MTLEFLLWKRHKNEECNQQLFQIYLNWCLIFQYPSLFTCLSTVKQGQVQPNTVHYRQVQPNTGQYSTVKSTKAHHHHHLVLFLFLIVQDTLDWGVILPTSEEWKWPSYYMRPFWEVATNEKPKAWKWLLYFPWYKMTNAFNIEN